MDHPEDNTFVGFGKHEDLTFQELIETDKPYIEWLFKQSWFSYKYPGLYNYLISCGMQPEPLDSSDEEGGAPAHYQSHNAYQAKFTDCDALMKIVNLIDDQVHSVDEIIFEDVCNADIVIRYSTKTRSWYGIGYNITHYAILIELKPTVSNDYPEILRQIRAQKRTFLLQNTNIKSENIKQALVTQSYTGNVGLPKVKRMFGSIVFLIAK